MQAYFTSTFGRPAWLQLGSVALIIMHLINRVSLVGYLIRDTYNQLQLLMKSDRRSGASDKG